MYSEGQGRGQFALQPFHRKRKNKVKYKFEFTAFNYNSKHGTTFQLALELDFCSNLTFRMVLQLLEINIQEQMLTVALSGKRPSQFGLGGLAWMLWLGWYSLDGEAWWLTLVRCSPAMGVGRGSHERRVRSDDGSVGYKRGRGELEHGNES